jgi:cytochrome c oxidase subunit 2
MKRACRLSLVLLATALAAACNESHSVLAPHGPVAGQIATLTWVLLGIVAAVMAVVLAATSLAVLGPAGMRARLAQVKTIIIGGLVFPAVVLTALLVYGSWLMRVVAHEPDRALAIEVRGEQWWWRVRHQLADGLTIETANEIRMPVGRPVMLTLTSADVIHSIWIPSLAGKMDMIPGRITRLWLRADRPGIYRGACAEYCGGPHAVMALHAVALPSQDFDRWLEARRQPAVPDGEVARRGRRLFEASGCGGCHAVAGTGARGTIGPNLSDLGARHSIGAGALPMSADNLALFVANGQRFKPANRMPPFAIFSAPELADLATYLLALK